MNLTNWNPFREMDDFFNDYRGWFGRALPRSGLPEIAANDIRWRPVADISETDKEYVVKAELPEVRREDVSVTIENGVLKLEGTRKYEKESDDEKQHRTESFYGTFYRAFTLPENVDEKNIRAESKDGVLKVHLPKTAEKKAEPRKIAVK